jgi:hypothetical protein
MKRLIALTLLLFVLTSCIPRKCGDFSCRRPKATVSAQATIDPARRERFLREHSVGH